MTEFLDLNDWERKFRDWATEACQSGTTSDPAHDPAHLARVARTAQALASSEGARLEIILPAAWLHDLVNVPKDDPRRAEASRLSAAIALERLRAAGYPGDWLEGIGHAIEAHSFSGRIEPRTPEARVVQDADRLDGLGAIGIARCFAVAGQLGTRFYDPRDPWARERAPDDRANAIDHFFVKLFRTVDTLRTAAGRAEGRKRAERMRAFLSDLGEEIGMRAPDLH